MTEHSQQFLRKRKFLLVLPVLIIPLTMLLVWSMGLGKADSSGIAPKGNGFNVNLPSPDLAGGKPTDKLSLYRAEDEDSMRLHRQRGLDSTYSRSGLNEPPFQDTAITAPRRRHGILNAGIDQHPDEARIRERLAALDRELNKASTPTEAATDPNAPSSERYDTEMQRLEQLMGQLSAGTSEQPDPQMSQVKEVLERIMDVQHPELVRQRLQEQSKTQKGLVLPVTTSDDEPICDYLQGGAPAVRLADSSRPTLADSLHGKAFPVTRASRAGFYEVDPAGMQQMDANAITAVIHDTRTVVSGATVKFRLTQDVFVQGQQVPAGTFLFGDCKLEGERLQVNISAIRIGNSRLPVSLAVYDYDGNIGIPIRDMGNKQTTSQGADQALQSLQLYSMDPSIGAQAASAGVETVKSLIRKKVKLVKATVKADYPVLLIDTNAQGK
ncbi:conjugative transposon protein TraM [Chitinophaga tropicalis]|uniref:Conjugative transposon protein TraM n=1 Tax=Chitinophaga tropicalis TaxID=2683588 RepID=A0A7K1U120_9BACT|nr:conjugative transposon protein TraM [Chitinophaga tropicalis]MVT07695.1 conjugative transposon protein TraM [Chitinophaga tropicalis]